MKAPDFLPSPGQLNGYHSSGPFLYSTDLPSTEKVIEARAGEGRMWMVNCMPGSWARGANSELVMSSERDRNGNRGGWKDTPPTPRTGLYVEPTFRTFSLSSAL